MLAVIIPLLMLPSLIALSDRTSHHKRLRSRSRPIHASATLGTRNETLFEKRDSYNGRATYYDVGLGACGGFNVASDWIVAQNSAQFGSSYPSPNCGKSITISYNGITGVATIQDECPSCGYGALDMSRGLFDHFASEDLGEFQMTWWYNDGSGQPVSTSQTPTSTQATSTSTWSPPATTSTSPTSTWVALSTTSTWTPSTTTSTSNTTTFSSTTISTTSTSSTTSTTGTTSTASTAASTNTSSSAPISSMSSSASYNISASPTATTTAISADHSTSLALDVNTASSNSTATATSSFAGPLPTEIDQAGGNLLLFNQAVAYLGHIVVVGAGGV